MPEILSKVPQQFADFWNNLDKNNKSKMIAISVIVLLSLTISIVMLTRPQYYTLVSQLESRDARDVIEQLKKSNIDFKLLDNGIIQVKKNDLNKAKASLLQEGLPKGSVNFEDYNKTSLGTTDADRRRRYKEYKERDLEATLKEMDNVRNAIVKLSIPEKTTFFGGEQTKVKASVAIDSYSELTSKQIKGIEKFIAGSVEDLSPADVTILDSSANILNDNDNGSLVTNIDKQYTLKQTVIRSVEKQLTGLLGGLADNVRVMANLEFDFDTLVTSKEMYEPVIDEQGIVRSKEVKNESAVNSEPGGVPGTDSNLPSYPAQSSDQKGEYKLKNEIINYEVNKIVTQTTKEIGKIDRENSSIAVALYYTQSVAGNGETDNNSDNVAQNRANTEEIKTMVASATGIPIRNIAVYTYDIVALKEIKQSIDFMNIAERYGPIILVAILIILIAIAILKRNRENETEELMPAVSVRYSTPIREEEMVPDIDLEERSEVKKQIEKFVKQKPEAVAQLLRNWLTDDWD